MYEIFEKLLNERGVSAYRVAQETGVSTATLTSWKKGKYTPKPEKLQKIADYFGVSLDYLMNGEEKKYYLNDETAAIAQEIFENKDLRMLFDASRDASPEDLKTVQEMMLALKRKERGDLE